VAQRVARRDERLALEIGDQAFAIPTDVSHTSELNRLLDQTVTWFGGLSGERRILVGDRSGLCRLMAAIGRCKKTGPFAAQLYE
jgi:hypothetical protein